MKPTYCTRPEIDECIYCSLVNYGLDCANNPIARDWPAEEPSKRQQVSDHELIARYLPSEKDHHLDALEAAGLLDALTVDQLAEIVKIAQAAYRNGQRSIGAERIDTDAVWLDGVGGIEKQADGTWKVTMPDRPGAVATAVAAATLGASKSDRKTAAARENGKKGGRPRGPRRNRARIQQSIIRVFPDAQMRGGE